MVEQLTLHKLRKDTYDRRGPIATLTMREIPNWEYAVASGAGILQKATSFLSDTYRDHSGDPDFRLGEQNESWVSNTLDNIWQVRVLHKYWSDKQTDAFCSILLTLAALHGWQVKDERS